jgi:predicted kinase
LSVLVLVAGHPATGKSTAAHALSERLGIPLVSRDDVKERIFDALGWSDREWSDKVSDAAAAVMADQARAALSTGNDVLVESVFDRPGEIERLGHIVRETGAACVVVVFQAYGDDLLARYRERNRAGGRHPGHADGDEDAGFEERMSRPYAAPEVAGCPVLEFDASDIDGLDLDAVVEEVRAAISRSRWREPMPATPPQPVPAPPR